MAKMKEVGSRDEYTKNATQGFVEGANSQIGTRKEGDEEYITKFNETTDAATNAITGQYQGRIDKAPDKFQGQYDANAVAQAVQRKQLEESMANMGLTNSGLNVSNQTALAVQRMNADASTRAQQDSYVSELESAIDQAVAQGEYAKSTNANETRHETHNWATDLLTQAYRDGQTYGRADYSEDYGNLWNQYVLDTELEQAEINRKWQTDERIAGEAHTEKMAGINHGNNLAYLGAQYGYNSALQEDSQTHELDVLDKSKTTTGGENSVPQIDIDDVFKYMELTGADYPTAVSDLTGQGSSANNSAKNVTAVLTSGVKDWDVTNFFNSPHSGAGFWGTFFNGPEGDGKEVYTAIVVDQLKKSPEWNNLSNGEKACVTAQAIGKGVGITWQKTTDGEENKNKTRIESALKAAGYNPKDKDVWNLMVEEATKAYKNVR